MLNNEKSNNTPGYLRFKTRIVHIGTVPLGGYYPVRLQSMTNTNTLDTEATVDQAIRIFNRGADYVRITTPSIKEAENLVHIKKLLNQKGYLNPIIADIHFNPKVAEIAAKYVEKIRINPGNFVDRKNKVKKEYSESDYKNELSKIKEKLNPLFNICIQYNTAVRIGTNQGSLSNRIINRYGNTPEGMAESAMEFLRICEELDFHEIVVSIKASNTLVMVQATRLLVSKMVHENMNFPLHLGVTEAGDGDDGRIKSAAGIGTLLSEGLGDTIRVSLTEDPEVEIPFAKALLEHHTKPVVNYKPLESNLFNPYSYKKRETTSVQQIGSNHVPVVICDVSNDNSFKAFNFSVQSTGQKPDFFYTENNSDFLPEDCPGIIPYQKWQAADVNRRKKTVPLFNLQEYLNSVEKSTSLNFISVSEDDLHAELYSTLRNDPTLVVIAENKLEWSDHQSQLSIINAMQKNDCHNPVIIHRIYKEEIKESLLLKSASDCSALFLDGLAEGIWLSNKEAISMEDTISISFGILQTTRSRISKTDYIACPSCGRTLFDIQKALTRIKEKTVHLKGLKIAVMGCIVNGPGEMTDADYGYVGTGKDKVSLYKRQNLVKNNIPASDAVEELIKLIKDNGDWK